MHKEKLVSVEKDKNSENNRLNVLTRIHPSYTLSDTPEPGSSETESLIVKNFLNTLAEISLSISSRKNGDSDQ